MSDERVILVTGATSGIGRAASTALAHTGATLVAAARNEEKAKALVDELREVSGNDRISYLIADLSLQSEAVRLARDFKAKHERLDVLINNAGAMFTSRQVTEEGLERTFALNHMGPFVLTNELLDLLRSSAPSRIVNVASDAHKRGHVHWDDLQLEQGYATGWKAYAQSKLCNILFTRELARRLEGSGVRSYAVHPGFVNTGFLRNNGWLGGFFMSITRPFQRKATKGAETVVWAAISDDVAGLDGAYLVDKRERRPTRAAQDDDAAKRLWDISEQLRAVDQVA